MNVLLIIQIIVAVISCLVAVISIPLFFPFRWPAAAMWVSKVYISAISPFLILWGLFSAMVGLTTGSIFISLVGAYVFSIYSFHFISVTRPPANTNGFEQAFGEDWEESIPPELKTTMLPLRTVLSLPDVPKPRLEQNISFCTIPGTQRQLLCDIWQPPLVADHSGVGFIYLHGSAFYFLDKDYGTRPFFSHLASQGHVIMDVAYRLAPETDIMGMVQDVKRAIAWMKVHAAEYGIDPDRIVLGGGSAGGHLALLAAYTRGDTRFTPGELANRDLGVCGVVSLYGPTDLAGLYYHTRQDITTRNIPGKPKKKVPKKMPGIMIKSVGEDIHRLGLDKGLENVGTLAPLMGGHPDEVPEKYALLSPLSHVHPGCPPTLLVHGNHDIMAPVATTRLLNERLKEVNVPVVMHILPQTDHAFDLILPRIAPAEHNLVYDVERFLALMALGNVRTESLFRFRKTTAAERI